MSEPRRYSLVEIGQLLGGMSRSDSEWMRLAIELRTAFRSALRRDGFSEGDISSTGWNFEEYVTDADSVIFEANSISFVERDTDGDRYYTDLPYAVADGHVSVQDWVDGALASARARLTERRIQREQRERQRQKQVEANERRELERLRKKYPNLDMGGE